MYGTQKLNMKLTFKLEIVFVKHCTPTHMLVYNGGTLSKTRAIPLL